MKGSHLEIKNTLQSFATEFFWFLPAGSARLLAICVSTIKHLSSNTIILDSSTITAARRSQALSCRYSDDRAKALRNHHASTCCPVTKDLSKYQDWLPTSWCKLASPPETNSNSSGIWCTCKVAPSMASPNSVKSQYCSGAVTRYLQVT